MGVMIEQFILFIFEFTMLALTDFGKSILMTILFSLIFLGVIVYTIKNKFNSQSNILLAEQEQIQQEHNDGNCTVALNVIYVFLF